MEVAENYINENLKDKLGLKKIGKSAGVKLIDKGQPPKPIQTSLPM